ncbi:Arginyl-tRNA--protein transferase 1 [Blattella germanica]|nr:Arginyl-tRNA--protein transferase 1 [Blattella germanica]
MYRTIRLFSSFELNVSDVLNYSFQQIVLKTFDTCAALDFKISKSQKKVLKRIHRYLSHGDTKVAEDSMSVGGNFSSAVDVPDLHKKALRAEKNLENSKVVSIDPSLTGRLEASDGPLAQKTENDLSASDNGKKSNPAVNAPAVTEEASTGSESRKVCRSGTGADVNRPPCKKAKLLRQERKHQKLLKQGYSETEAEEMMKQGKQQPENKSLEDLLNEPLPANRAHRLEIRLVRSSPPSHEFEQTSQEAYEVYRKYQMAIHGDPPDKCSQRQYMRFLVNSPLQLVLLKVGSPEFMRSMVESQKLFAKYQMAIHNEKAEDCTPQTFAEFLVDSPLEPWHPTGGPPQGYGSFHQQYWMDDRLIAVGVIDILPRCVSSVYFYYDPDLGELELSLTRSLHGHAPLLQYYYMGFYIHTCPKMRYKASYNPSFLLCPETYTWHPIVECKARLDRSKYCRFNDDSSAQDKEGEINTNEVLVLYHQRVMTYRTLSTRLQSDDDVEEIAQYAKLVGMKCARRMLLLRT